MVVVLGFSPLNDSFCMSFFFSKCCSFPVQVSCWLSSHSASCNYSWSCSLFLQPHFLRVSALSHIPGTSSVPLLTANFATSPVLQISVDHRTALTTGSSCRAAICLSHLSGLPWLSALSRVSSGLCLLAWVLWILWIHHSWILISPWRHSFWEQCCQETSA